MTKHRPETAPVAFVPKLKRLRTVEHVGHGPWTYAGKALRPVPSSPSSGSYEGIGLSVSVHPEEWSSIARLGTSACSLVRADGSSGKFAVHSSALLAAAEGWAVMDGWARRSTQWFVSYWNDEDDRRVSVYSRSKAEALSELESYAEIDENASIGQEPTLRATAKMSARWRAYFSGSSKRHAVQPHYVEAEVVNLWLAAEHCELDGVWWQDAYDPSALSAPRGVILPHALPRWRVKKCYALTGGY